MVLLRPAHATPSETADQQEFRFYLSAGGGSYHSGLEDRVFVDRLSGVMVNGLSGLRRNLYSDARSVSLHMQYLRGPWQVAWESTALSSASHHMGTESVALSLSPLETIDAEHSRWNSELMAGYDILRGAHRFYLLIGYDLTGQYARMSRFRHEPSGNTGFIQRGGGDRIDVLHNGRLLGIEYRYLFQRFEFQVRYLYQYSPFGRWESERKTYFADGTMDIFSEIGPLRADGHRLTFGISYNLSPSSTVRMHLLAGQSDLHDQKIRGSWFGNTPLSVERFLIDRTLAERTSVYREQFRLLHVGLTYRFVI